MLSFFFQGLCVLKYADSSNQGDFFLHGLLVLQICPIKLVDPFSPRVSFQSTNKEFIYGLKKHMLTEPKASAWRWCD